MAKEDLIARMQQAGLAKAKEVLDARNAAKASVTPNPEPVLSDQEKNEKERGQRVQSAHDFESLYSVLRSFDTSPLKGETVRWESIVEDITFDIRIAESNRELYRKRGTSKEDFLLWLEQNIFLKGPEVYGIREKEKELILKKINTESYEIVPPQPMSIAEPVGVVEQKSLLKNWEDIFGRVPQAGDVLELKSPGGATREIFFDGTKGAEGFYTKSGRQVPFEEIAKKIEKKWSHKVSTASSQSKADAPSTVPDNVVRPDASFEADLQALKDGKILRFQESMGRKSIYTVQWAGVNTYKVTYHNNSDISGDREVNETYLRTQITEGIWKRLPDEKAKVDVAEEDATKEAYERGDVFAKQIMDLHPGTEEEMKAVTGEKVLTANEEKIKELDEKIVLAKNEVEEARKEFAMADYKHANNWKRLANFFGFKKKNERNADLDFYEANYNNKLMNLRNLELERIKESGVTGETLKKNMVGVIESYKKSEPVILDLDRMQVKAKHQGFPGKVMGAFESIGRFYNKRTKKEKYAASASLITLGGVTGGASLIAGRFFSSAGAFVGTDVFLQSLADRSFNKKAAKEVAETVSVLDDKQESERLSEADIEQFKKALQADIFSLDTKLQERKKRSLYRKMIAGMVATGVAVGLPGWLFNELGGRELVGATTGLVMKGVGGHEIIDAAKKLGSDYLHDTSGSTTTIHHQASPGAKVWPEGTIDSHVLPIKEAQFTLDKQGLENALGGHGMASPVSSGVEVSGGAALSLIESFVNQDYVVQKGDSVWKLAGKLADQVGLEGAQRTFFIDAVKDQYGEVLLKEGEVINFSEHGIDANFVEQTLAASNELTTGEIQSIESGVADVRTALGSADLGQGDGSAQDFVQANQVETLTTPSPQTSVSVPATTDGSGRTSMFDVKKVEAPASSGAETPTPPTKLDVAPLFTVEFQPRVDDWGRQIFQTESGALGQDWVLDREKILQTPILSVFRDFRDGTLLSGLNGEQVKNFVRFMAEAAKSVPGEGNLMTEILREKPGATAGDFLEKVASIIERGARLGSYTTPR